MQASKLACRLIVVLALAGPAVSAQTNVGLGGGGKMSAPVITPNNVWFVACDMGGIYRSTNEGLSWTMLNTRDVFSGDDGAFSVAVDPANASHLIAAHPYRGVMESSDNGITWTVYRPAVMYPPGGLRVTTAAVSGESTPRVFLGSPNGVYRIDSTGSSWSIIPGLQGRVLRVLFLSDSTRAPAQHVFVATSAGVFSLDGTTSSPVWNLVTGAPSGVTDLVGGSDSTHYVMYAATGGSTVYRYASEKGTWETFGLPSQSCFSPNLLALSGSTLDRVYASSSTCPQTPAFSGRYVSGTPASMTWTFSTTGAAATAWVETHFGWGFDGPPHGIGASPLDANKAFFTTMASLQVTLDGAASWTERYTRSVNAGANPPTWQTQGIDVTTTWNYYRFGSRSFIANTDVGLSKSDDGFQWSVFNGTAGSPSRWDNYYELTSDNQGRIWAAVSRLHDIPHDKDHVTDDATVPAGDFAGSVIFSPNNGDTWTEVPLAANGHALPAGPVVSVLYRSQSNDLFASVWGTGVYHTTLGTSGAVDWEAWGQPTITSNCPLNRHVYQLRADTAGNVFVLVALNKSGSTYTRGNLYQLGASKTDSWTCLTDSLPGIVPTDFTIATNNTDFYVATWDKPGFTDANQVATGGLWKLTVNNRLVSGVSHVLGFSTTDASAPPGTRLFDAKVQPWLEAFSPKLVGNTLYLATLSHGVVQSNDSGASWSKAFTQMPFGRTQRIATDDSGAVYVTTFGGGLWQVAAGGNFDVIMVRNAITGLTIPIVLSF